MRRTAEEYLHGELGDFLPREILVFLDDNEYMDDIWERVSYTRSERSAAEAKMQEHYTNHSEEY